MRLDTTTDKGADWAVVHGHRVDGDDPGASDPIDLCYHCAHNERLDDVAGVEHPPYEDDYYTCIVCGVALDDVND